MARGSFVATLGAAQGAVGGRLAALPGVRGGRLCIPAGWLGRGSEHRLAHVGATVASGTALPKPSSEKEAGGKGGEDGRRGCNACGKIQTSPALGILPPDPSSWEGDLAE